MKPSKITDKENEIILFCSHEIGIHDPRIFTLDETENKAVILWLCEDCFNQIGTTWVRDVLTIRVKTR